MAAVVLYHLWPDLVPGGYVGVDVFFVISGFLITGLLVRELEATGRVDLLAFYAGRIRRLLPAALLVLGTSLVVLVLFMPPVVWRSNIKEIGAAALYSQNWALSIQQVDYFAGPHAPTLVQHYWSLSLEEQFYLVWPIVLVVGVAAGALGRLGTVRSRVAVVVSAVGLSRQRRVGGVGTFAVQLAHALGAEVTAVCRTRNVDLVRSLGATLVVAPRRGLHRRAEVSGRLRPRG